MTTSTRPPLKLNRSPRPKLNRPQFSLDDLSEDERLERCLFLFEDIGIDPPRNPETNSEWLMNCPDPNHDDRHPSCSLNWTKLTYHCHGCGEGGGILKFIMVTTGRSMSQALSFLKDGCGHPGANGVRLPRIEVPQTYHPMSVLDPWRYIHPYLTDRGIAEANIIKHDVGWDRSCDKIVIPVIEHDDEGQRVLLGWQTRSPGPVDPDTPKYQCSPGLQISKLLYNGVVRSPKTVVVESPLSVVAKSHLDSEYGFVATFGGPKKKQYDLLAQYDPLILWFDSDEAGWKDAYDVGKALPGKNVHVVNLPFRSPDMDELDDATVLKLLTEAIPYKDWIKENQGQLQWIRQPPRPKAPEWHPWNH